MGSWNLYRQDAHGRRIWPIAGYPQQLDTFHPSWWITSTGLNWAIRSNTLNEFRYGVQHSGDTTPRRESKTSTSSTASSTACRARFTLPSGSRTLANDAAPITGRHYITTIYDTMTLLRGNHTFKFGGNYPRHAVARHVVRRHRARAASWRCRATRSARRRATRAVDLQRDDDAGHSERGPGQRAISLYSLLTGRVSQVQTGRVVDPATLQYSDTVVSRELDLGVVRGVFVQDSWRLTPDFTLNYGLRWEVSEPPFNHTGTRVFPDLRKSARAVDGAVPAGHAERRAATR